MRDARNLHDRILTADGATLRDRTATRAQRDYVRGSEGSLSRKTVIINDEERDVLLTSGSSDHIKTVQSMPNEVFYEGDYMLWGDRYWLISDVDRDAEIRYRGTARQCNRQLRWQNAKGEIVSRWCASDERATNTQGLSYRENVDKIKTVFTLFIPLDEETAKLRRYHRFIMDVDLEDPDVYVITSRNVISKVYDPEQVHGVIMITVSQDERNQDKDNLELQVADYDEPAEPVVGTNCEIAFEGKPTIKAGGSYKEFTAVFYDSAGNEVDIAPVWDLTFVPDTEDYYEYYEDGKSLFIKAANEPSILRSQVRIELKAAGMNCDCVLFAKVVYVL